MADCSPVSQFYAGRSVLVTGATGFVGKVLVEKLLRSCPAIDTVYLLIRVKKGVGADQRLQQLIDCPVKRNPQPPKRHKRNERDASEVVKKKTTSLSLSLSRFGSPVFHIAFRPRRHGYAFEKSEPFLRSVCLSGSHLSPGRWPTRWRHGCTFPISAVSTNGFSVSSTDGVRHLPLAGRPIQTDCSPSPDQKKNEQYGTDSSLEKLSILTLARTRALIDKRFSAPPLDCYLRALALFSEMDYAALHFFFNCAVAVGAGLGNASPF